MSIFSSADAYRNFADFLTDLGRQAEKLKETIPAGSLLWRAQLGHDWYPLEEDGQYIDGIPGPFGARRMVPDRAREGRANLEGIPCLYLATHRKTALSEAKPLVGSLISVARFETLRDLTVVNVTFDERPKHLSGKIPEDEIDQVVRYWIDEAFSKPVTLPADYAPTQIMADLFRTKGFNGVGYKSCFGYGYNVALFNIADAKWRNCFLFEKNTLEFRERAAPIYSSHRITTSIRTLPRSVSED